MKIENKVLNIYLHHYKFYRWRSGYAQIFYRIVDKRKAEREKTHFNTEYLS